ncbi:MAG: hypothetical protein COA60_003555 [Robiginitomaculum sp.]|nr:hypothetical protein [Robiginitomaculum sp.]
MLATESAKLLLFSGGAAILFSSLLGVLMLMPLQAHEPKKKAGVNFKHIGAAHLDWIILGLMQGLAGALIWVFALDVSLMVLGLMIFGGWINPLAYVFKAFGVNAFQFSGGAVQQFAAALGGLSSLAIIVAWTLILFGAYQNW